MVKLSANERKAFVAFDGLEIGWCLNFKGVKDRSELPQHLIRRTVRAIARKGLLRYEKGLWTEGGDLAGSGYGLTKAGQEYMEILVTEGEKEMAEIMKRDWGEHA